MLLGDMGIDGGRFIGPAALGFCESFSTGVGAGNIVTQFGPPPLPRNPHYACAFPVPERNPQPSPDLHAESGVIPVSGSVQIQAGVVSHGLETGTAESTHVQESVFHLLGAR